MRICQDYKPDDIFIAGFVCKLFSQERHGRFDAISSDIALMFSSAERVMTWSGRNADRYPQPPKPATVVPTWAALLLDDSPFEKLPKSESIPLKDRLDPQSPTGSAWKPCQS